MTPAAKQPVAESAQLHSRSAFSLLYFFLWLVSGSSFALAVYELAYQHHALDPGFTASGRDIAAIFCTLWLKNLTLMFPGLLLSIVLHWRRLYRAALVSFLLWWSSATGFVCLELEFQRLMGNRFVSYLGYIADLIRHPAYLNKLGGSQLVGSTFVRTLGPLFLAAAVGAGLCFLFARFYTRIYASRPRQGLLWPVFFALLGLLAATFTIDGFDDPRLLVRLNLRMPSLFGPVRSVCQVVERAMLHSGTDDRSQRSLEAWEGLGKRLSPHFATILKALNTPQPVVKGVAIPKERHFDVLIIAFESSNPKFFAETEQVPELNELLQTGLVGAHYSAATNASNLGIYELLYGRDGVTFDRDLDAKTPPQLTTTLGENGYKRSYLCGADHTQWQRMGEYLTPEAFDFVKSDRLGQSQFGRMPDVDAGLFKDAADLLNRKNDEPQFVLIFPNSTHFPYAFPPKFDIYKPSDTRLGDQQRTTNRYRNAVAFVKTQILQLLRSIDLSTTLVVLVGDHGEALWEDGTAAHATRFSDAQTRTHMAILGAGIKPLVIEENTTHADIVPTVLHALAGKHVDLPTCHGRDLLNGPISDEPVFIFPNRFEGDPLQLVFAAGDPRIALTYWDSRANGEKGRIEMTGLFDKDGLPDDQTVLSPETMNAMEKALLDHLAAWTRQH